MTLNEMNRLLGVSQVRLLEAFQLTHSRHAAIMFDIPPGGSVDDARQAIAVASDAAGAFIAVVLPATAWQKSLHGAEVDVVGRRIITGGPALAYGSSVIKMINEIGIYRAYEHGTYRPPMALQHAVDKMVGGPTVWARVVTSRDNGGRGVRMAFFSNGISIVTQQLAAMMSEVSKLRPVFPESRQPTAA